MGKRLLTLALALAALGVQMDAQAPPGIVRSFDRGIFREFDRFKNLTTFTVDAFDLLDASGQRIGLTMKAKGLNDGTPPTTGDAVLVIIDPDAYKRPTGDKELDLLADGVPLPLHLQGSQYPRVTAQAATITEWIEVSDFRKLTQATVVEGRAYGREFRLTAAQLTVLRDFYALLYPPAAKPSGLGPR